MANVAICMAMDIMYTVLFMRLGSNSLYKSTNCSALQEKRERTQHANVKKKLKQI